jgi:hypothetical protein
MNWTAPMSRRRKLLVVAVGVGLILFGAVSLWQSDRRSNSRFARVLLLDPRTGKTLHEQTMNAGYAVAALLADGRVAVGTLDSCPDHKGGHIVVLDASLQRVIRSRAVNPCLVAKLDPRTLRARFEPDPGPLFLEDTSLRYTVRLGSGKIVQSHDQGGLYELTRMAAYDANGKLLWKRNSLGRIGAVDVRGNRVLVPVYGTFTPGAD